MYNIHPTNRGFLIWRTKLQPKRPSRRGRDSAILHFAFWFLRPQVPYLAHLVTHLWVNYAKQTQFPQRQNQSNPLCRKGLWNQTSPTRFEKTKPIKPNSSPKLELCSTLSEVEKVIWSDDTVWINKSKTEGFKGVTENVWNFHIGGYQVCQKWLKDRKGRKLSKEDIEHYHKIVVALNETIRIMKAIDEVIDKHGGLAKGVQHKMMGLWETVVALQSR